MSYINELIHKISKVKEQQPTFSLLPSILQKLIKYYED